MWKNDIRAPSVPTLRPLPSRTALLSSSMTNCVTTVMAKLSSGRMIEGNGELREHGGEVGNRQRLPEQDAAIAALSVQRVERVENPDDKSRAHDQSSREFVRYVERLVPMRAGLSVNAIKKASRKTAAAASGAI